MSYFQTSNDQNFSSHQDTDETHHVSLLLTCSYRRSSEEWWRAEAHHRFVSDPETSATSPLYSTCSLTPAWFTGLYLSWNEPNPRLGCKTFSQEGAVTAATRLLHIHTRPNFVSNAALLANEWSICGWIIWYVQKLQVKTLLKNRTPSFTTVCVADNHTARNTGVNIEGAQRIWQSFPSGLDTHTSSVWIEICCQKT